MEGMEELFSLVKSKLRLFHLICRLHWMLIIITINILLSHEKVNPKEVFKPCRREWTRVGCLRNSLVLCISATVFAVCSKIGVSYVESEKGREFEG